MLNHFLTEEQAIEWLINYAIDFININPTSGVKMRQYFISMDRTVALYGLEPAKVKEGNPKAGDSLSKCRQVLHDALYMAFTKHSKVEPFDKKYLKLSKTLKREGAERRELVEDRFNTFLSGNVETTWEGFGNTYTNHIKEPFENGVEAFEYLALNAIARAFYSYTNESGKIITGEGFKKIGLCSNCYKVFEKKRKDQVLCSERCRETAQRRRYRARKK